MPGYTCTRCQAWKEAEPSSLSPRPRRTDLGLSCCERSLVRDSLLSGTAGNQDRSGGRYVCSKQPKAVRKDQQEVSLPRILHAGGQACMEQEDTCGLRDCLARGKDNSLLLQNQLGGRKC